MTLRPYCLFIKNVKEISELFELVCFCELIIIYFKREELFECEIYYKIHISFFYPTKKKFIGETYEGPLHKVNSELNQLFSSNFSDLVYFLLPEKEIVALVFELVFVGYYLNSYFL
jgi:hypothetical protein